MIVKLAEYLASIDKEFSRVFVELGFVDKRLRPKTGLIVLEPSRTSTANALVAGHDAFQEANMYSQPTITAKIVESPELVSSIKAFTYANGQVVNQLKQYVWSKREAVADAISGTLLCLNQGLLLPSLVLARAAIEQIGDAVVVDEASQPLFSSFSRLVEEQNAISIFSEILHKHVMATRIDWNTYILKRIRGGKNKGYKPAKDFVNLEAKSTLDGVDQLEKHVKGCRMAYEFLCEFAHPNVGAYFAARSSKTVVQASGPFPFVETTLSNHTPSYTVEALITQLFDCYSLLLDAGLFFEKACKHMDEVCKHLLTKTKEISKVALENYAPLWAESEPCPCLSGLAIGGCCGKRIFRLRRI